MNHYVQAERIQGRIGHSLNVGLETDFVYRHSTARRLMWAKRGREDGPLCSRRSEERRTDAEDAGEVPG